MLPGLEERGYITRTPVADDRRRTIVTLAREGLRLIGQHGPDSEKVYDDITHRFGPARLEQLFRLLRELERVLEDGAPRRQQRPGRRRGAAGP
jgi:DNA-binding MarR family transcriptional regulator